MDLHGKMTKYGSLSNDIKEIFSENGLLSKSLKKYEFRENQFHFSNDCLKNIKNSGILIDTPGMRELGITECYRSLESTFQKIFDICGKRFNKEVTFKQHMKTLHERT